VIGSGPTALGVGYFGEIRQEGHAQTWPRATTAAVMGAEAVNGSGSNGVDHSDSRLVERAGQVVCRPEKHS
jgi:hypothetical protein